MNTRPSITNDFDNAFPRAVKLRVEERLLKPGVRGGPDAPGSAYQHHAQLASDGERLYASFSEGDRDEDQCGQRMMLMTCDDDEGLNWSSPRPIVDRQPGRFGYSIVTGEGVHVAPDGSLTAYAGHYDRGYEDQLMYYAAGGNGNLGDAGFVSYSDTHTRIMRSDDRGGAWREVGRIDGFVPNLGPCPTASGRLILPGNVAFPYTDDPTGRAGWEWAGLPRLPRGTRDDPEGFILAARRRGDPRDYCEASFFQTDDGVIHMMLRTNVQRLAVTRSEDYGATWSEPLLTDYTDCNARHHFGRLPDGRFFGLSTPRPDSPRTPLVLAVSEDGERFDRHFIIGDAPNRLARVPGVHKYGRYGYPQMIVHRGHAYVIYSINKEDIALARFEMDALS